MPARHPEQCDELFAQYLNAADINSLLHLYEPRASHVRADGSVATGHRALRGVLEEFLAMEPQINVRLTNVVTTGDNLAVLYDEWSLTGKDPDGNPLSMEGKGVHVVRRQHDGAWRFAVTGVTNAGW